MERPPGILIIGNFLSSWQGGTAVCEGLATRLAARGWRVFTAAHSLPRAKRLSEMLSAVWRWRGQYDVAVVDAYAGLGFRWAEAVCELLRALGKPYVLVLHDGRFPEFAARFHTRFSHLVRNAAATTVPSGYLLAGLPQCRPLLRLVPNPLDVGLYPFRLRSDPRPRLVWLRAFHSLYNPALALEVVGRLAADFPDVTLAMVGPEREAGSLAALRRSAAELGVAERVTFPGFVHKAGVPLWLDQGDVFLNTTDYDNTPISVMEAMACGLCVVSTDVGGLRFLVRDAADALLVPPRNAESMAAAVRRVLSEPGLGARLSARARLNAEKLDWSVVLPKWEMLLASVSLTGRHPVAPS